MALEFSSTKLTVLVPVKWYRTKSPEQERPSKQYYMRTKSTAYFEHTRTSAKQQYGGKMLF